MGAFLWNYSISPFAHFLDHFNQTNHFFLSPQSTSWFENGYVYYRAVAAGPISPVSTGPLFPLLVACLAMPISAIAWRTPTQHREAHRYHVETCEMAANSAREMFRKSSNNFPFLQANN